MLTLQESLEEMDPRFKEQREVFERNLIKIEKNKSAHPLFRYYVEFSQYFVRISFAVPVIDFKGRENKSLSLILNAYGPEKPYWLMWLRDERGYGIGTKSFGCTATAAPCSITATSRAIP